MKKVIVVGFKTFGSYKANVSRLVAERMAYQTIKGFEIRHVLFAASIAMDNRGRKLTETSETLRDVKGIVALGMASEKTGLCIETVATNQICGKYVPDDMQNKPASDAWPYLGKVCVDLRPWNIPRFQQQCITEGIPVMQLSNHAGGFCCNQLMFQYLTETNELPFIFIHVPCCPEAIRDPEAFARAGKVTMTADQVIKGLTILLENASI